eukprot:TRINITY_DN31761_c0_g1_i2.p2 TRINITY_DN31761_c0_g1~~TRINITY_DN31761_c0_g1_i2.p2  ORF type:complete len:177 (-),score=10.43 TRINITY_DN31761_c0_g1_i2:467-997(-)
MDKLNILFFCLSLVNKIMVFELFHIQSQQTFDMDDLTNSKQLQQNKRITFDMVVLDILQLKQQRNKMDLILEKQIEINQKQLFLYFLLLFLHLFETIQLLKQIMGTIQQFLLQTQMVFDQLSQALIHFFDINTYLWFFLVRKQLEMAIFQPIFDQLFVIQLNWDIYIFRRDQLSLL